MAVLVTRPAAAAAETVARLRALGFDALAAPMLRIVAIDAVLPPPATIDAVVVASRHAIDGVPDGFAGHPIFTVGHATARRAAARFATVVSADGDAAVLARLVAERRDIAGRSLLLPTARGEGVSLAAALRGEGFAVHRRTVYAQCPVAVLPDAAREALARGCLTHAMFFSARTASVFARLAGHAHREALRDIVAVTIGPAAAVALGHLPWRDLRVAARPTQDEMLVRLS